MQSNVYLSSSQRKRTVEIVRRHEQLQTQLSRDINIRHVFRVLVLLVVVEVLADLLQYKTAANRIYQLCPPLHGGKMRGVLCAHLMFSKRHVLLLDSAKPSESVC